LRRIRAALALGAACALAPALALGQSLIGADLQKRVNGVLALMGYMLTPDVTTGSLAISNGTTGNPDFAMTTAGGGFTVSKDLPLYLEGTLGYAQYDPTFVASNGQALVQIEHLMSYPIARERKTSGALHLSGWWFDIENGDIYVYEPESRSFEVIDRQHADRLAARFASKRS
jgi:hypothetical protein